MTRTNVRENNKDRTNFDTDISADLSHLAAPERPISFSAILPSELVSLLDDAYLLFLLSTSPSKALPPGKSLASVLPRAVESLSTGHHGSHESPKTNGNAKAVIEERVTDIVQKAFWDDVRLSIMHLYSPPNSHLNLGSRVPLVADPFCYYTPHRATSDRPPRKFDPYLALHALDNADPCIPTLSNLCPTSLRGDSPPVCPL